MIARFVLILFLCAGMVYDLRNREIPASLTLGVLTGAGAYALFHALWIPVFVVAALLMASDLDLRSKWLAFAVTMTAAAFFIQPETGLIAAFILLSWILWECGYLGGADVKLLAAATIVFATPLVLVPIALLGGIQGVIACLRRKREIPFVVSICSGSLLYFVQPYF